MESVYQDLRLALRSFLRKPGFFAVAVITLALGIGATTAIFSVVSAVLLRPLPYADADRLVFVRGSYPDLRDLGEATGALSGLAVSASNLYDLEAEGDKEYVRGDLVSADFFGVLGIKPARGRTFTLEEDIAGGRLAVISDALSRRRFGGGALAVGRSLRLNGDSYTVVGVMPPHIAVPSVETELWLPMRTTENAASAQWKNRAFRIFRGYGRLAPGVGVAQAQAAANTVAASLAKAFPDTNAETRFDLQPLRERIIGPVRPALLVLLGMVAFVLLIACANVAHLVLARALARRRELAVRAALGAGRARLARQLLTESLLLSVAGGLVGVLLALWGVDVLRLVGPRDLPRLGEVTVDGTVLVFAAAISILTGVLFGLAPALQRARAPLTTLMREGSMASGDPRRAVALRRVLVIAEVALSVTLVVGAALLGRSFMALVNVDTGMKTDHALAFHLTVPYGVADPSAIAPQRAVRLEQVVARVRDVPGVVAAGAGNSLPPTTLQRGTEFLSEDGAQRGDAGWVVVTSGYLEAAGARIVAGRTLDTSDSAGAEPALMVNAALARRVYGSPEAAVGKRLRLVNPSERAGASEAWRRVVGVAGDVKYQGLDADTPDMIYTPIAQTPFAWGYLIVRTAGAPEGLIDAVRDAVAEVAPEQPASNPRAIQALVAASVAQPRFQALLLGLFALVALLLAAVGVYGLVAYGVVQRTRDIGIRMALGAGHGQMVRWMLWQGLALAGAGVVAGIVLALALSKLVAGLLFGVSATDPLVYVAVAAILLVVTALASWLPARRAARVDPMVALRAE